MDITHHDEGTEDEYAMIEAAGHHIQVSEKKDKLHIYINGNARIEVVGEPKENPRITLDSGKFDTDLQIKDSEGSWETVHYPTDLLR